VLVAVRRDSFADDVHAIVNRLGNREHFEIARGEITKKVEIVHLAFNPNESVLGAVTDIRRSDNNASEGD
jgi:hypothetical protein